MRNSRDIADLHPIVAEKARRYLAAAEQLGIDIVVISTLRDAEMQEQLWGYGRSRVGPQARLEMPLGNTVTRNPAGHSFHEYGLAFDAFPIVHGRLMRESSGCDLLVWRALRRMAHTPGINLRVGIDLKQTGGPIEFWHHQYTGGLSIDDLRSGRRLPDVTI